MLLWQVVLFLQIEKNVIDHILPFMYVYLKRNIMAYLEYIGTIAIFQTQCQCFTTTRQTNLKT